MAADSRRSQSPAEPTGPIRRSDVNRVSAPLDHDEREARMLLTAITQPGDPRPYGLLARHGSALEVLNRLAQRDTDRSPAWRRLLDRLRRDADACSARLICPGDPEWPPRLNDLTPRADSTARGGVPFALWVRGPESLPALLQNSCTFVGSQAAGDYGRHVAGLLATELAAMGATVVSGAGFGIDAAAQQGALATGAPTGVVLPCGVDIAHPAPHRALLEQIAHKGLLISEIAPGRRPTRQTFALRTRLLAALTAGTVVIEALAHSRALHTVAWARRCGRPVMAVPGPITSNGAEGPNRLLHLHQATAVTNAEQIHEALQTVPGAPNTTATAVRSSGVAMLHLGDVHADGRQPGFQSGPSQSLLTHCALIGRAR